MFWPTLRPFGRKSDVAAGGTDPFTAMRREMDRVFENFGRDLGWSSAELPSAAMAPALDVSETDKEIKIEADLPGVEEKDVEVVVTDNVLTIKGEKKAEKEEKKKDYHMVERSYGSFARSIALPFQADPDKVKATFAKGVLNVTVPKPPEVKAKEKKIAIGKG